MSYIILFCAWFTILSSRIELGVSEEGEWKERKVEREGFVLCMVGVCEEKIEKKVVACFSTAFLNLALKS